MAKRRRIVVFGVFDVLHPGHLAFLAAARRHGTELVVVVTRDVRVLREKGKAPVFTEKERLAMLRALRTVDRAVLGDPPASRRVVARLRPDAVAVGHDQRVPPGFGERWTLIRLPARRRRRYSTSRVRAFIEKEGI